MITRILAISTVGALLFGFFQTSRVGDLKQQILTMERDQAYAVAAAQRESAREISRLIEANQEIQRDYNQAMADLDNYRADRAQSERVRNKERTDIVGAAERVAAACGRYAEAAERDLEFTESERSRFGQEAAAAAAVAHALKQTLDERRKALDARRQTLKEN